MADGFCAMGRTAKDLILRAGSLGQSENKFLMGKESSSF